MKRAILRQEDAMFSRQKRWMSEEAIIAAIDAKRAKQRSTMEMADRFLEAHKCGKDYVLTDADRYTLSRLNETLGYGMTDYKGISNLLSGRAERMEDRIKELGHKLAAFRTELLSFTDDPAVV